MGMHEHFSPPSPSGRTLSRAAALFPATGMRKKTRRGCGAAARRRARRYLAKRRRPKALWPILAALFFIAIAFERPNGPMQSGSARKNRAATKARSSDDRIDEEVSTSASDTGAALNGDAAQQYRPPFNFQAKHAAQIVAFLVRNRGRLDTDVVREKWKHLDGFSLPLALYLRDIDANGDWSVIEEEIAASAFPMKLCPDRSSWIRHRRILELIPEWVRRGEELLASLDAEEPAPAASSDHHPKDDDTPPKPTRR